MKKIIPTVWSAVLRFNKSGISTPPVRSLTLPELYRKMRVQPRTVGRIERIYVNNEVEVELTLWGLKFLIMGLDDDKIEPGVEPPPHLQYPDVLTGVAPRHLALSMAAEYPEMIYYLAEPPTAAEMIEALAKEDFPDFMSTKTLDKLSPF